jgi:PAS domain-containing protein
MKSRALPAIKSPNKQSNESDGREKLLERLNLAFKATKTAIWDWDIENNLAWSSPGNQLLFGLVNEESTDSFNIKDDDNPWVARLYRDDRARVLRCLHDHLENDAPYEVEYRYRLPDDEYIWIRSMGQAVRTPDGRALRMVGSNSDITAQKSAELEAQRFREAVDNASEGVVLYDADERFVFANKRYREMASAIAHLLTPGTHREEMRRHQSVGGTAELQLARGLWMKRSDHVLPDGSVVSVRTDITEIKAAGTGAARERGALPGDFRGCRVRHLNCHRR